MELRGGGPRIGEPSSRLTFRFFFSLKKCIVRWLGGWNEEAKGGGGRRGGGREEARPISRIIGQACFSTVQVFLWSIFFSFPGEGHSLKGGAGGGTKGLLTVIVSSARHHTHTHTHTHKHTPTHTHAFTVIHTHTHTYTHHAHTPAHILARRRKDRGCKAALMWGNIEPVHNNKAPSFPRHLPPSPPPPPPNSSRPLFFPLPFTFALTNWARRFSQQLRRKRNRCVCVCVCVCGC